MMKKLVYGIMIFTAVLFTACGGTSVETSAEMQDFVSMIKGTSDDVTAALEKYAANDEVLDSDMAIYNLESPEVLEKNGDCYLVKFTSGIAHPAFELCWENGKLVKVTDKGFK